MHNHLRDTHKFEINSASYQQYLKEAVSVLPLPVNGDTKSVSSSESGGDDLTTDFEVSAFKKADPKILNSVKIAAKDEGLIDHDIYASEEDEDFIMTDEDVAK